MTDILNSSFEEKNGSKEGAEILHGTRSGELQEIVGRMPSWIIRWGITVVTSFICLIFVGLYFIKYPDVVTARVSILNSNPSLVIKSEINSTVSQILLKNNETVKKDQAILIFSHKMNLEHLNLLDSILDNILASVDLKKALTQNRIEQNLQVPSLQNEYNDLLRALHDYNSNIDIKSRESEDLKNVLNNIKITSDKIHHWRESHILTSPIDGNVSYLQPIHPGYFVKHDEALIAIIPTMNTQPQIIGKIPANDFAKVKKGQKVLISLDAFPSQYYGFIEASVLGVSEASFNNEYVIDMQPHDKLVTTKDYKIPRKSVINGGAEIIIDDKSILERMVSSLIGRY